MVDRIEARIGASNNKKKEQPMMIQRLKRLFSSQRYDRDHLPDPIIWLDDPVRQEAVLINLDTGRLLGVASHDGCGKHDCRVYVWPWEAFGICSCGEGLLVSLRAFPRMIVELPSLKIGRMIHAKDYVEEMVGLNSLD